MYIYIYIYIYIPDSSTPLGQRCIMVGTSRLHFSCTTPLGQRCTMVVIRSRLYLRRTTPLGQRCYGRGYISVTSLRWANVVLWLLRSRLHFRRTTALGQHCIMVATVAVAFPSQHSVGPTLYNGCNGHGCISVTSLRWANVV